MWKDVKAILLPTKEKSKLVIDDNSKKLHYLELDEASWGHQELYIISLDEEINKAIRDGDWYYNDWENIIYQQKSAVKANIYSKKIIATTDSSLEISRICPGKGAITVRELLKLPQIPQQFIEEYISEYNKKNVIEDVQTKYEEYAVGNYGLSDGEPTIDTRPKISKDNFIFIRRKETKLYTREEVETLCKNAYNYGFNGGLQELSNHHKYQHDVNSINEWLTKYL